MFRTTITILAPLLFALFPAPLLAQIPPFLSSEFGPNKGLQELEVTYGTKRIVNGKAPTLAASAVSSVPKFKLCDSCGISPDTNYIILLVDVDAQGQGKGETPQALHFLQTNFKPGLGGTNIYSSENALASYVPPKPKAGTGKHRYIWLLFLQRSGVTASEIKGFPSGQDRKFDVIAWAKENKLGLPLSGVEFNIDSEGSTGGATTLPAVSDTTTTAATTSATPVITTTTMAASMNGTASLTLTSSMVTMSTFCPPGNSSMSNQTTLMTYTMILQTGTAGTAAPSMGMYPGYMGSNSSSTNNTLRTPIPPTAAASQGSGTKLLTSAWIMGIGIIASVVFAL